MTKNKYETRWKMMTTAMMVMFLGLQPRFYTISEACGQQVTLRRIACLIRTRTLNNNVAISCVVQEISTKKKDLNS